MKENELMIGDWVEYRFTGWTEKGGFYKNYQYVRISTIGKLYVKADHDRVASADGEEFFPISLTPEILEMNGFKKDPESGELIWCDEEATEVVWLGTILTIHGEYANAGLSNCIFVHQLQHALRLCGIEKEITL